MTHRPDSERPLSRASVWNDRIDKVLLYGLMAALLVAPSQAAFKMAGMYVSPVDPLIWGLFGIWLGRQLFWRRSLCCRPPAAAAFFFVAAVGLSVVRAGDKTGAVKDLVQSAEYFLAAWILFVNGFTRPGAVRWAIRIHLGAAVAVLALAAAQYWHTEPAGIGFAINPVHLNVMQDLGNDPNPFFVRGTFGNRNILGGYLALILPLSLSLAISGFGGRRWRPVLAAVTLAGLLLNLSGGTLLALAVALPFVALCHGRRAALITVTVMLLMFVLVLPRMPRRNFEVLHQSVRVFEDGGDMSARYTEWLGALVMWHEQPLLIGGPEWLAVEDEWGSGLNPMGWLFGVGAGNFQRNIGMYYGYLPDVNINATEPDSHNTYLVLLSTVGLLGVLGFVGMLLQSAATALRKADACGVLGKGLCIGAAGALLAYAVNAVWAGLMVRGIGIPLAFTLALPSIAVKLSED